MIKKSEFKNIYEVLDKTIKQVFGSAKKNSQPGDYLLFLAGADKNDTPSGTKIPYVFDYQVDEWNMDSRIQFLEMYLNNNYFSSAFPTTDTPISLTFELLLYMQIWGEKSFLKKLHRLAALCNGGKYVWDVSIPEFGMPDFIEKIITSFKGNELEIAKIMDNTYLPQIRNAAAHDEYRLSNCNSIVFLNYKGKEKQIQEETFNDWTKRFTTTFLLEYHLFNEFVRQREKTSCNFPFPCTLKDKNGNDYHGTIIYNGQKFEIQG